MFGRGTPTPRIRGPKNGVAVYNLPKLCMGFDVTACWGFAAVSCSEAGWGYPEGRGFAVGLNSTEGLEFAVGVENALGKAMYPCWSCIYK